MASALVRDDERGTGTLQDAPLCAGNDGVLPTDVLREVLLRLTADVLCRHRLVCRSWRSLTSDPSFAKAHSRRHPLAVGLRTLTGTGSSPGHYSREVQFLDLYSGDIVKRMYTLNPWAGHYYLTTQLDLLCITQSRSSKGTLLNASTGAVISLPSSTAAEHEHYQSNQWRSMSVAVLGQVPSTGECKLLRIHPQERDSRVEQACEVITLWGGRDRIGGDDGRKWRVRPRPPNRVSVGCMQRAVSGGIAYFLLAPQTDNVKRDEIASFDLATEEWRHGTLRGPHGSHLTGIVNDEDLVFQSSF